MKVNLKYVRVILLLCLSVSSIALAGQYKTSGDLVNGELPNGPKYKGIPEAWWASYFIKEFDKYAPAPGAYWTLTQRHPEAAADWFSSAMNMGWATSMKSSQPKAGAIAIRVNHSTNWITVYIVREVLEDSIIVSGIKYGDEHMDHLLFRDLDNTSNGFVFMGYIYPEKIKKQ